MRYGFSKQTGYGFEEAILKVTEELQKEGFGVLTTIDVKATLKKKLDADFRNYVILGACNPPFAHKALQAESELGLLMPCNVVVQEQEGKTSVSFFDPELMAQVVENEKLKPLAAELKAKLQRVYDNI